MAASPLDMSVDGIGSGGILSFSWGAARAGTSAGTGAATGKATYQDIHVTRKTDGQSPAFLLALLNGKRSPKATLHVGPSNFNLTDVSVSSYQVGGTTNDSTDQISLTFARVEFVVGSSSAKWDISANKSF